VAGVEINAFMSACAWNLRKMMEDAKSYLDFAKSIASIAKSEIP